MINGQYLPISTQLIKIKLDLVLLHNNKKSWFPRD